MQGQRLSRICLPHHLRGLSTDGNTSDLLLPGNLHLRITGVGMFYPDGRKTQQVGIIPDVRAVPTIAGITQGRDEVLERAEQLILQ